MQKNTTRTSKENNSGNTMTNAELEELLTQASDMGFLSGIVGAILIALFNLGFSVLLKMLGAPDFIIILLSWAAGFTIGVWVWYLTQKRNKHIIKKWKEYHADKD